MISTPAPNAKDVRIFCILFSFLLLLISGVIVPLQFDLRLNIFAMPFSLLLVAIGLIRWQWVVPFYLGWIKIGKVIGSFNTKLMLSLVYLLLFLPYGVIMKLMGKDSLNLKLEEDVNTYLNRDLPAGKPDFEKPY